MAQFPTDPSTPTLPETLPLSPRLRLLSPTTYATMGDSDAEEVTLQMSRREQILRAKQLLLQLKNLGQTPDTPGLQENLALLRLTIRSLELGEPSPSQLSDVRLVLDEVTRHLNQRSAERRTQHQREQQRSQLSEWFETAITRDSWPLELVRELAQHLHREYLYLAPPIWWHQATPADPYLWAASHGLNTAQVLQRMLHPLKFTSRHILNAILAGLLHDLGMARLPVRVLSAQEQTNTTTRQQWRAHATWLAERLRSYLKPEEFDVAQAIAQHHERLDGTGYPHQLKAKDLLELGKQLAVADAYAALCQPRPHRAAYSTRQATLLVLRDAQQGRLDDHAALLLLPWSSAPAGSNVELNDGASAKVIAWPSHGAAMPLWQPVVGLGEGQRMIDLSTTRDRHLVPPPKAS
jgi:HD-GYP domain-containing protein (c-di-GMP phosphodiesterase class II)